MNFFEHQAQARRKSRRMIWLFVLAVLVIVVAINLVVIAVLGLTAKPGQTVQGVMPAMLGSTLITLGVVGIGSLYKTLSLREGGGAVARAMGGTLVPEDPRDFQLKRLRNVVEEMSIASGVPVPEIYVLDKESGINAFAAGYAPADAAIAVTRGALDRLSRDELQGVVAHEYSHILNGDMRLNLRLMGLIFGLLVLGISGRKVLEHMGRGGSRRDGSAILLIALAVMIFGYLGVFLGRLIKAYVSRQREYLADASAVQFTRLSHGLSGALMKIGAFQAGSRLTEHNSEEIAHMLFGDGVGYSALTATHPPLVERIRRIDPAFDPALLTRLAASEHRLAGVDEEQEPASASALLAGATASAARRAAPAAPEPAPAPAAVVAQIANPAQAHVEYASAIRAALPPILTTAAHMRERAIDVIVALLLARETDPAAALDALAARLGEARRQGAAALIGVTATLHAAQRLPLAQLAMPAIKRRPPAELRQLLDAIEALILEDGRVDLFEYVLARLLRQQLDEAIEPGLSTQGGRKLIALRAEANALLAVLARQGHRDPAQARRAYLAGAAVLFPGAADAMPDSADWMAMLDQALPRLDALLPAAKETLVLALATTALHDGLIAIEEAELLRLVCNLLHCPLPPLLTGDAG